jgi:hypothetical protein
VGGCWCALAPFKASYLSHRWILPAYREVIACHRDASEYFPWKSPILITIGALELNLGVQF